MPIRSRNLYTPGSPDPFKLSRSKVQMFLECPRCFYLDRRLRVDRVDGPAFTLNSATDALLKKEMDAFRERREVPPIAERHGLTAVPFQHPQMDDWRANFRGVTYLHPESNLQLSGAIDDLWQDLQTGELIVVDYKSTSSTKPIDLNDAWKQSYKRQMEFYQWLLRRNGLTISNRGYFLYVNARTDPDAFHDQLLFTSQLIPYDGNDDWVDETITAAGQCLAGSQAPAATADCKWCDYRTCASAVLTGH